MKLPLLCCLSACLMVGCAGLTEDERANEATGSVVPQSGYAEVSAGRLYYEVAGSGDAIVLVHGNTGDRRHWDLHFETLAQRYRVIRYDVRGYGLSSVPAEGEAYTDFDDLVALMDQLGIESAHLAGWSMGSGIAIDFAIAHPARAKSLICLGPWINGYSSPGAIEMFEGMGQVVTAMAEGGVSAAVDALMNASFMQKTLRDSVATERFRNVAAEYSFWGFANPSPQLGLQPGAMQRLAFIQVPTLVMVGEHDVPACLEIADLLDETVPDSRKVLLAGTGHMMQLEKPDEVYRVVVDFLSGISQRSDGADGGGSAYLGQPLPGAEPQRFAPGIVSTGMFTRDVAISPDGKELYFGVMGAGFSVIVATKLVNNQWTDPEVASFSADAIHQEIEPHISPDGLKLLFLSDRRSDGAELQVEERQRWLNSDIWVVDRIGEGWGEPYNLGHPVNTDSSEFFPSMTRDGTLYFSRSDVAARESYIYRSRLVDGVYSEPERLPEQVNSTTMQANACIAPDESYIIVPVAGREDSFGGMDYYVVFRDEQDRWSEPINLGDRINTPSGEEYSPYISPDGRYFFFMSSRRSTWSEVPDTLTYDFIKQTFLGPNNGTSDIFWVDAGFIEELRPAAQGASRGHAR